MAIADEDSDGVAYYAFCSMGQPAAENFANNEDDAG